MTGVVAEASTEEPHRHSWHQFVAVTRGIAVLEDEQKRIPVYAPYIALIPAGSSHQFLSVRAPFNFNALFVQSSYWQTGLNVIRVYRLDSLGAALMAQLAQGEGRDLSIGFDGECAKLFLKLADRDMADPNGIMGLPRPREPRVCRMVDMIEARWDQAINLADVGAAGACSARHALRLFERDIGLSPAQYQRNLRMIQAAVYLADPSKTVLTVASECGYESVSVFYFDFKRQFGCSPKEYRAGTRG